jgi:hypothetical protein
MNGEAKDVLFVIKVNYLPSTKIENETDVKKNSSRTYWDISN